MTDQTTDLMMPRERNRAAPLKREFYAYFTIIFLATLPLAILTWALTALRQFRLPAKGPIARAWSQARVITPMIFAA
ncbi:cytochrome PufQ [Actibacterium sp. 188UL27-1]|uniref:cytochrome PufQ n=1 Tax=Actibacterium sp. 188UL27-1 TaxID=2786961 RepID=UPI00195F0426|nr:cytochrome PufQ [Actibacterium sp. 188UL27-1]MBM7070027.1 protein pufQ [Actibacterium sp. 188UL27-1]